MLLHIAVLNTVFMMYLDVFFHIIVFMYLMTTSLAKGLCYLFNVVTIHMLLNDAFTDDCSVVSVAVMSVSVCLCL